MKLMRAKSDQDALFLLTAVLFRSLAVLFHFECSLFRNLAAKTYWQELPHKNGVFFKA
jgi:hypothetical protein